MQLNNLFYADDNVIYFAYEETVTREKFDLIISTLQKWFCDTKPKLNTSKTEFVKVVQNNSSNDLKLPMDFKFLNHVKLLGFILDVLLLFSRQISSITSACFYMLRNIYSIRNTVDNDVLIELVRVMVNLRLDYWISLYYELPAILHRKLQRITNYCMQANISTVTCNTNFRIHQPAALVTCAETCAAQKSCAGYLSSPLSRNDKVIRCQYFYKLQILVVKTTFAKRSFSHAIPH